MPEGGGALSARAGRVVALVGAALASVWAAFLLRDVAGVASDRPSALTLAAGLGLLDWVRWILLSLVVASAAHAAGRAGGPAERRLMRVAVAAAAHLVGAVGLIRNSVLDGLGSSGTDGSALAVDVLFVGATTVPLVVALADLRRGTDGRPRRRTTAALIAVVGAGALSALRSAEGILTPVGRTLDAWLLGGRVGQRADVPDWAHHHIVETLVGDTLAVVSAVLVLLVVLAAGLAAPRAEPRAVTGTWPRIFALGPGAVLRATGTAIVSVTLVVYLADIRGVAGDLATPAYLRLFNDGPLEWIGWVLVAAAAIAGGYASGRLAASDPGASSYFLWFSAGLSLVLVDELSHFRHALTSGSAPLGEDLLGISRYAVVTVLVFGPVGAVLAYGLLWHGRHLLVSADAVRCALAGYALYGSVAIASAVEGVVDGYERVGALVDRHLLGGRLPIPPGDTVAAGHFLLTDGLIDEAIEVMASALLLAVVLTYVRSMARAARSVAPLG